MSQLRQNAKILFRKDTANGVIEIYDNGFFTFKEDGHTTIYGVDRCEQPDTYHCSGEKIDLSRYSWDVVLEWAGSTRLEHNADNREEYYSVISIDAPESQNNPALSVRPEQEIREEEEKEQLRKQKLITALKSGLSCLKPNQIEILKMRYVKKLTFQEIAKHMGITESTACINCRRAKEKLQKLTHLEEIV